jgi:hypothetical protein
VCTIRSQLSKALAKKIPLATAPAHAAKDVRREARWNAWACACNYATGRPERGDIILLYVDERGVAPSFSRPRRGGRGGLARASVGVSQEGVAMLGSIDHLTRQLIVHTSRPNPAAISCSISSNLTVFMDRSPGDRGQADRAGRGQWSSPSQQVLACRPGLRAHWLTVEWMAWLSAAPLCSAIAANALAGLGSKTRIASECNLEMALLMVARKC